MSSKATIFKKIIKDNNGTILLMTFLILASIITASIGVASIMVAGIRMGGTQARSTKAYFAAEAGAERILWEIRKNSYDISSDCCPTGCYVAFSDPDPSISSIDSGTGACDNDLDDNNETQVLPNSSEYIIKYEYDDTYPNFATTTLTSYGSYGNTSRVVELKY